jgi:hypothetical protein
VINKVTRGIKLIFSINIPIVFKKVVADGVNKGIIISRAEHSMKEIIKNHVILRRNEPCRKMADICHQG